MHIPSAILQFSPTLEVAQDYARGTSDEEFRELIRCPYISRDESNLLKQAEQSLHDGEAHVPKHGRNDPSDDDPNIVCRIALYCENDQTLRAIVHGWTLSLANNRVIPFLQEHPLTQGKVERLRFHIENP